jgi:hypothetical protein
MTSPCGAVWASKLLLALSARVYMNVGIRSDNCEGPLGSRALVWGVTSPPALSNDRTAVRSTPGIGLTCFHLDTTVCKIAFIAVGYI